MSVLGERPTKSAQPKDAIRLAALSCRHDSLPDTVVIMIKHEPKVCLFCEEYFEPHPKVGSRRCSELAIKGYGLHWKIEEIRLHR